MADATAAEGAAEAELRRRWDDLTSFVSAAVREKWWALIRERYAARPFHNQRRLVAQLRLFDEFKDQLRDRYAVGFAIFFKHLECDADGDAAADAAGAAEGGASAAERNVQRLHEFCAETTFDQENYVADLLTASANNCTDAHLNAGEFGADDLHYFIDFDTAWMGADRPADYERAAADIREEARRRRRRPAGDDAPDDDEDAEYRRQRLRIPNIFATRPFRERFEAAARANVQREIDALRARLAGG